VCCSSKLHYFQIKIIIKKFFRTLLSFILVYVYIELLSVKKNSVKNLYELHQLLYKHVYTDQNT